MADQVNATTARIEELLRARRAPAVVEPIPELEPEGGAGGGAIPKTDLEVALEALERDNVANKLRTTEDMIRLEDVGQFRDIQNDGTLVARKPRRHDYNIRSSAIVIERLMRTPAALVLNFIKQREEVGLPGWLAIAGGAIASKLSEGRHTTANHDIDCFFGGMSEEDADHMIDAFGDYLYEHSAQGAPAHWIDNSMRFGVTERCVTYAGRTLGQNAVDYEIQIVLRRYNTIGEVIHTFDLGSSAFILHAGQVMTTSLGRYSLEYGMNVLNLARRRQSLEFRLTKYESRGFGIALPDARTDRPIPINENVSFPFLDFFQWGLAPHADGGQSYYGESIDLRDETALATRNMRAMTQSRPAALCASGIYRLGLCVRDQRPTVTVEMLCRSVQHNFNGSVQTTRRIAKIFGNDLALEFAKLAVENAIHTENHHINVDQIRDLCTIAAEAVNATTPERLFKYMEASADLAAEGPLRGAPMTAAAWYGDFLRPE